MQGVQEPGPFRIAFQGTLIETGREVEEPGLELAPTWDAGIAGRCLTCCALHQLSSTLFHSTWGPQR